MTTQTITYPQKPSLVNVIAWMTLASGIVNLGWGLAVSAAALLTIVGICCTPITILPAILGIFEIVYAAKLLSTPPQVVKPATNLAVLEVVCILTGNFFSMVVGILSLIFYNDKDVKEYFARLNETMPSEPAPSASPQVPAVVTTTSAPVEEPIPSPITGETATPPSATPGEITLPAEEAPKVEPEPPVPPTTSTDETVISSVKRDGVPDTESEPPAAPDVQDPNRKEESK